MTILKKTKIWFGNNCRKNLVGVNTHLANKIVLHGLENNELKNNNLDKTRFDFLVKKKNKKYFIEVKCNFFRNNNTEFPDAVTTRGSKHF